MIAITAIALWAAHRWLAPYCPPDFNWHFVLLAVFGLVGGTMMLQVIASQPPRAAPPEYGITQAGVLVPSKERPVVRWANIASFTVEPCRHSPHARTFVLHLKSARRQTVLLPGGGADTRILSELSSHLPESAPPAKATPVGASDWIVGFSAMVLVWAIGAIWLQPTPTHHASASKQLILLIGCFAGPGTWIALVLSRRRATSSLVSFALLINMFSTLGGMVAAVLASLLMAPR